ncbi:aldose epimerase family protein [Lactiplantibacillus mudanjiangensis]|uniref:Galactose mutarotase [Lactobacillus sp.] n=1 Tax=Lactiplantibacillus mudanjiangensis TaxID=1296538 RepID=A0A660DUS7_9LACO|nr:aldose epimerase family protein [Lactiplantibacillus mudanjiangensis]VDG21246.1 galactose mutarotase [Lactobacillus sp.] [Lactiplantibacillus mudanjiangensis]VDG22499.1 galactose mutarotase [Lactobacillus sp.] [Lactiplantibacillus mudanjiangensis]VDG26960.1 galactose mutarotase [Lactobacillus sp.] [Lactiplantibacillus mudanjiangensis]VDG32073.1 galactose mutarotase [Lactobacillus sp.] [Lactiplantibacillus mudanjiangensis]
METKKSVFGQLDGQDVIKYTLVNDRKTRISVLSYGGTWQEFVVNENGTERPLIWGLDSMADYQRVGYCLCQSIGRVAGRIGGAKFDIDGQTYNVDMNEQTHSLHGGAHGFNTLLFDGDFSQTTDSASVTLSRHIESTEDDYPGNLDVQIKFTLDNQDRVSIAFTGDTDAATLFNPTNHVYWNVTNDRTSLVNQTLQIHSDQRLEFDGEKVPTGKRLAVKDTAYDFNYPQPVQSALDQLKVESDGIEFDDAYEVTPSTTEPIAVVGDTDGHRQVKIYSDRNSLIIYTANPFDPAKETAHQYNALATEAQTLPDAINHDGFGDIVLRPDQAVTHTISYQYEHLA